MKKNELFYPSRDKKTNIHMVMWEPDNEVLGVIQVVHGVSEHIMRYEEFAKFFTDKGIAVVGIDLLGHGLSTNNGEKVMYFGPSGSWDYVVDDVDRCLVHIKEMYPNIPVIMLGFSLGSFLVRTHMIEKPGLISGAILVGTGYTSDIKLSMAQSVIKSETKKYGENNATDKIRNLTFGTYNKKFQPNKTECDWLCSNYEELNKYLNDPLVGRNMTVGLFRELIYGMKFTGNKSNIKLMNKSKPILLLSGKMDAVGDFGKGVETVYKLFKNTNIENVTMKIYDNKRHDILHEEDNNTVFTDIYNWLINNKFIQEKVINTINKETPSINNNIVDNDKVESILLNK